MNSLRELLRLLDRFTDLIGKSLSWLALAMALLTAFIVVMRYGFNRNSIFAQELVSYMHASLFLLGAAYALKVGAHVRVDIFYRNFTDRGRAWVNSLGGIVFLIPVCLFILVSSWDFVAEAWAIRETSPEPGGIPAVYLLKSLIPLMALNLLVQGIAETVRNALFLLDEAG